jgi:hypothetical protein
MTEINVSWSRLKSWEECRQKAHLRGKGVKSPSSDVRVFFKGTVTDRVLRDWLQDPNRADWEMPSKVQEYMDLCEQEHRDQGTGIVRWQHADDKADSKIWCERLLTKVKPLVVKYVLPFNFEADKRFKAPIIIPDLEGNPVTINLIGIMDILVSFEDWHSIYDLKATENEQYWKKTIAQLVFYDIAMRAILGTYARETALLQPMCKTKIMPMDIQPEDRTILMGKIIKYAHSVMREDFAPKEDDAGCNWCDVRSACAKFKPKANGRMSFT